MSQDPKILFVVKPENLNDYLSAYRFLNKNPLANYVQKLENLLPIILNSKILTDDEKLSRFKRIMEKLNSIANSRYEEEFRKVQKHEKLIGEKDIEVQTEKPQSIETGSSPFRLSSMKVEKTEDAITSSKSLTNEDDPEELLLAVKPKRYKSEASAETSAEASAEVASDDEETPSPSTEPENIKWESPRSKKKYEFRKRADILKPARLSYPKPSK